MVEVVVTQKRSYPDMIKYLMIFALILLTASFADASADNFLKEEKIFNESYVDTGFSKIYIDGFGVNSDGFKLILRTYERLQGSRFKPFLADIEYVLITREEVVYSKRVEQIQLPQENEGITTLSHHAHIALEEGRNYTGIARVYLYRDGIPEYYLSASSVFTAKNDAEITEVFGDGIGASATLKSKSMVPLNSKIIFTLKQGDKIIETRDIAAPSIMSNDKEKTVNILWTESLNEGTYRVSVLLEGKEIIDNHDKMFTVDKRTTATTNSTNQPVNSVRSAPGFTSIMAILIILILLIKRRR
ncbi:MAG: hypothetical protein FIB07_16195 [Candidatus Methanoperedens sp.]|nr:hypothetical protein [Candidatus Methanoperedens sp.]